MASGRCWLSARTEQPQPTWNGPAPLLQTTPPAYPPDQQGSWVSGYTTCAGNRVATLAARLPRSGVRVRALQVSILSGVRLPASLLVHPAATPSLAVGVVTKHRSRIRTRSMMADRGRRVNLVGQTRSRRRDREFAGLVLIGTSLAAANFYAAGALNWNCPLREATGLLCPACGVTHALLALRQGNVLLAIQSNALAVLALAQDQISRIA